MENTPQVAGRTVRGQFAPGTSGHPGGKATLSARERDERREASRIFNMRSPWAARKVVKMAENAHGKWSESTELAATLEIVNRTLGKPKVADDGDTWAGATFTVQVIQVPATPVPGVLSSPIAQHVCHPLPAPAASRGEVVDMQ